METNKEQPGETFGPSGTMGTEWVPVGEGETLDALARSISGSHYWRTAHGLMLTTIRYKKSSRTNLRFTGSPMTPYDYARMASSTLKVEAP
jgi:hypothetical protein